MSVPDVTNILKTGALAYIAPVGEALPAKTLAVGAAWAGNWKRLGFTKEPVKLAYEAEEADIEVEEILAPVKRYKTKETATIETMLAEMTLDYLQLGVGGIVTTTVAGVGVPGNEDIAAGNDAIKTEYVIGFEGVRYDSTGNALPVRMGLKKCTINLNGELEFSKKSDDYVGIALQANGLGDPSTGRLVWGYRVTAPATS